MAHQCSPTTGALYCFPRVSPRGIMEKTAEEKVEELEQKLDFKFSTVEQNVAKLLEQTDTINNVLQQLQGQQNQAERNVPTETDFNENGVRVPNTVDFRESLSRGQATSAPEAGAPYFSRQPDVQQEYQALADSVSRIKLVPDLKLNEKGTVKASLRTQANIVKKCGRYVETTLKVLSRIEAGDVAESQLTELFLCAHAQMLYLQDEYANVLAESRYGTDTAGIFRDLQTNTSVFTPTRIDRLKSAIELQAAHHRYHEPRGRGRGSFRGRSFHRGGRQDVFSRLTSRSIPPHRPSTTDERTEEH